MTVTLVVGTALLAVTLHTPKGSTWFTAAAAALAAIWFAGSFLSGPIPIWPTRPRVWRTVAAPAAILGVASFVAFLLVYLAARHVPGVSAALDSVLGKADAGSPALVLVVAIVNGTAEEFFFRGAVHAALEPRHPALLSTLIYVAVTAATGNVALIAAAAVMGAVFSLERLSTRSVLAPVITHVTWSTLMLVALPR